MVFADAVKMGATIEKDMQPKARVQMKDYPESRLAKLLPFPGGKPFKIENGVSDLSYLDDYEKYGSPEQFFMEFKSLTRTPPSTKLGKTTDQLIGEDSNVVDLELKEHDELL